MPANALKRQLRNAASGALLTACVLGLSGGLSPASATPTSVTFSFDSTTVAANAGNGVPGGSVTGPGNATGPATIATYMTNLLHAWGFASASVSVTNGIADNNYNADRRLVGPSWGTGGCTTSSAGYDNGVCPLGLWNTEGATSSSSAGATLSARDMAIVNVGGETAGNDRISMSFSGIDIDSISFDFEIFPDASCSTLGCAPLPDFSLNVNGVNSAANNWYGQFPGASGTYSRSPLMSTETAPQWLGVSGTLTAQSNASHILSLDFIDWPEKIGIDNLKINLRQSTGGGANVPEPGTLGLLGVGLAGFWSTRRKRRA
jgi:hypothetical protein